MWRACSAARWPYNSCSFREQQYEAVFARSFFKNGKCEPNRSQNEQTEQEEARFNLKTGKRSPASTSIYPTIRKFKNRQRADASQPYIQDEQICL